MYFYSSEEKSRCIMPESSWADDIDDHSDVLPSPKEEIKGDNKIVTEYALNEVSIWSNWLNNSASFEK